MREGAKTRAFEFLTVCIAVAVGLGIFELALRTFPHLIGVAVLDRFEPRLRTEIAARLGLPTIGNAIRITPEMRTDGGPTILLPGRDALMVTYAEDVDIKLGAIEQVQVDRNGLCNSPEKADWKSADILFAGDSMTYCTAVAPSDTGAQVLQDLSELKIYNLGVPGIGPDEYLELLKVFAPRLKPRVAVMNIFEGNDLRDVLRKQAFLETGHDRNAPLPEYAPAWSYAAQFLKANAALVGTFIKRKTGRSNEHNFRYSALVNGRRVEMNITNADQDEVKHALMLQSGEVTLDVFAGPLNEYVRWAKANDIVPILTYIPSMYTAYAATVRFEDANVALAVTGMSKAERAWFSKHAFSIGYTFLDLTPAFQEAANRGELTYFPANVHFTPQGHRVVAREVLALLRRSNLFVAAK